MNIKKLAVLFCFVLTSCGGGGGDDASDNDASDTNITMAPPGDTPSNDLAVGGTNGVTGPDFRSVDLEMRQHLSETLSMASENPLACESTDDHLVGCFVSECHSIFDQDTGETIFARYFADITGESFRQYSATYLTSDCAITQGAGSLTLARSEWNTSVWHRELNNDQLSDPYFDNALGLPSYYLNGDPQNVRNWDGSEFRFLYQQGRMYLLMQNDGTLCMQDGPFSGTAERGFMDVIVFPEVAELKTKGECIAAI